jgi:APA family basic amino acid/polyamine antiporter
MDSNLFKTKSIEQLVSDVEHGDRALRRSLSAWDLTLLGIGGIIGTGIFVLTGTAAANQAGPAITLSYVAAGLACAFAALCYAEFASMIPIAGSAYTYAYATLGELVAWMIGWDLILEYAVGAMTVAIGWSGYMQQLLRGVGIAIPTALSAAPPIGVVNILAVLIVLAIMALLVIGIRESARANAAIVGVKLVAVLFFIAAGTTYVRPENWSPFAPYGWTGIMAAAAIVFFAYLGFDAVSTTAEEARNPKRDLPIGIIMSLVVCTALYLAVAAVLSGIIPVVEYRSAAGALPGAPVVAPEESVRFLNAPVAYALAAIGQDWASYLVSAGAAAGMTSVLLVLLMSQPRIFFAMGRDGLLPTGVSKVHPRFGTPYITTVITCVTVALVAGVTQIQVVGEMTSIGTLFAFVVVCAAVLMLRVKRPDAPRPFRVPLGPVFPILGILSCAYLMISLPVITWVRFLAWLDIGLIVYWFYGRSHSPLADPEEQRRRTPRQAIANFTVVFGALGVFNGVCMFLLGLMTELGLTNETTAKWSELADLTGLHITAANADRFGLQWLGIAVGVFVLGWVLAKTSGEKSRPRRSRAEVGSRARGTAFEPATSRQQKEQQVSRICVVYHSGYGHTKAQADAVADGARSVPDTEVHQIPVQQIDAHWEQLHAADALIFGTPTYMGTVSAEFKAFMDKTSQFWADQPWKDKLAAAFTNSGSQHGDKLNTLISLTVFAAQHGMHWINLGLLPGHNSSKGSAGDLNRFGGFLGAMAQSNVDEGPELAPPRSDRETAFQLGRRVAEAARRWQPESAALASTTR